MSRHYYDNYMLAEQGIAITAVVRKELPEEVIKNNMDPSLWLDLVSKIQAKI